MRVASVSIARTPVAPSIESFEHFWAGIGQNTGNLMFTEAMFRLLDGGVQKIGFKFDPNFVNANFDVVVIPAANWLNKSAEWGWLIKQLEQVKLPIALVGIGVQAGSLNLEEVEVSASARELAVYIAGRSPTISVRGDFTKAWLASIGIRNAVTTGCPSIYMNIFDNTPQTQKSGYAVQGTRYYASKKFSGQNVLEAHLFKSVTRSNAECIYQSEYEELQMLLAHKALDDFEPSSREALKDLYCVDDERQLEALIRAKGKAYYDLHRWSDYIRSKYGVVGTRLHGTVLALNSGVPALLHGHDSRTQEVIDFAALPSIDSKKLMSLQCEDDFIEALEKAPVESYLDRRADNQKIMMQFFAEFGLKCNQRFMF
jgi:polysaccharide pyruvyl transferase WcaK-like protein